MFVHTMITKEGFNIDFYNSEIYESSVLLESEIEFSKGDFWIIDAGSNDDLFNVYETFDEDDSFVLIPKESVEGFLVTTSNIKINE